MYKQKKRHGCLRVWLVFMLVANSVVFLIYLFGISTFREIYPYAPTWTLPMLMLISILNITFVMALFYWKKWGFWGAMVTYTLSFIIELLLGTNFTQILFGVLGLVILYGVLQIGGEHKGWAQLE